jgi:adenine specific DNA methylase Mod
MERRLILAKRLLRESGVIAISIDDVEQAYLKVLCDNIFGEVNFITCSPVVTNRAGNQSQGHLAGCHEYILVYAKNKTKVVSNERINDDSTDWKSDEYDYYKLGDHLWRTPDKASLARFPIFIDDEDRPYVTDNDEPLCNHHSKVLSKDSKGNENGWYWGKAKITSDWRDIEVRRGKDKISLYIKMRPPFGQKLKSVLYSSSYSGSGATRELKKLCGEKIINNPKPVGLIKDLISVFTPVDATVLDFFAGAGVTGEAVMELNRQGGRSKRQFICVTNNENDIADKAYNRRLRNVHKKILVSGRISADPGSIRYVTTKLIPYNKKLDITKKNVFKSSVDSIAVGNSAYEIIYEGEDVVLLRSKDHVVAIVEDWLDAEAIVKKHISSGDSLVVYEYSTDSGCSASDFTIFPVPAYLAKGCRK